MPTVKCNKCEKTMTGGPAKFRAHNNPAENGAETCIKLDRDYQRKAEAHLEAELEKKRKAELERKRKTLVAVAQAKTDARKKQLKLDQMGMDDLLKRASTLCGPRSSSRRRSPRILSFSRLSRQRRALRCLTRTSSGL